MRFTIEEYAQAYSISPEMVHSRLRRNRLNYIIEDDKTYIVVPKHQVPFKDEPNPNEGYPSFNGTSQQENPPQAKAPVKRTTVATVINLYQKENRYLKMKIEELETKVDRLISEKEQLLKEERQRIEKVYQDKEIQLKTILELINTKLLQEGNKAETLSLDTQTIESTEVSIEDEKNQNHTPIELKQYLRSLEIKSAQRKTIKRRFAKAFGADSRILLINGLFYLDFDKYDYSDLLKVG